MTKPQENKWLRIYDDIIELDELVFTVSRSIRPDDLARALLSLTRLKVFIHAVPIEQARAVVWSLRYDADVEVLIKDLDELWPDLEILKAKQNSPC